MSIAERELMFEAIRRAMPAEVERNADSSLVANFTINKLHQISKYLTPMIGLRGVEVLFSRSLDLTSKEFAWLTATDPRLDKATQMAFVSEQLQARESNEASKASYTFFATFTELLISLIGISLTSRLLEPIWATVPPAPQKESKS
ncbi:MAG TPA: hypothetical protein VES38_09275 [Methylotenera sp.]|nr:hypothetical protein [Methylotenera sp.]